MHAQRRHRLLIALCLLTLAGCAGSGQPSNNGQRASKQAPSQARYHDDVLTFSYPASWTPRRYEVVSSFSSAIVYLSNQPLRDPCTRSRLPGGALSITCRHPISQLAPSGVLVEWTREGFPNWKLSDAPGVPQQIAGRPSKLAIRRPGRCASLGADETSLASITRPSGNWYQLLACLRGPSVATAERQVRQLIATTTVRG
jgi:hypothetical protein